MIMDSKGKLFGKISIIDILIVAIIIAGVGFAATKLAKSNVPGVAAKTDDVKIVLYADEVDDWKVKPIKVGDIVSDGVQNNVLGVVKDVKTENSVNFGTNEKGQIVRTTKEGQVALTVTIDGKGLLSNTSLNINNTPYLVGQQIAKARIGISEIQYRVYIKEIVKK